MVSTGRVLPPCLHIALIGRLLLDGYDLQFGTNVLGHAHLTLSLLPELENGAKTSSDGKARVVCTSSLVVYLHTTPAIRFETLRDGPERVAWGKRSLYCQSKFVSTT